VDRILCLASHIDVEEKVMLERVGEWIAVPAGVARSCGITESLYVRRHWRVLRCMRIKGIWVDCECNVLFHLFVDRTAMATDMRTRLRNGGNRIHERVVRIGHRHAILRPG
jgi:hypothetical protein